VSAMQLRAAKRGVEEEERGRARERTQNRHRGPKPPLSMQILDFRGLSVFRCSDGFGCECRFSLWIGV
jgi:hypothetical protein